MANPVTSLRVLVTSGIFPPDIGGPATHAAALVEELPKRGHSVTVISLRDGWMRSEAGGILRYPRKAPWPLRTAAIAGRIWRTRSRYDVVYATGLHLPAVLGAHLARRPIVAKVVGDLAWERARRLCLTEADFEDFQSTLLGGRVAMMRRVRNWALRHADHVTVPSEYLRRIVDGWLAGTRPPIVIPNRVRAPHRSNGSRNAPHTTLRTVFVGRLVSHKRIDILIRAVGRTTGTTLEIIGDGPEATELRQLARDMACDDRVRFSGSLPHACVLSAVADADALLLASEYEGLPHVAVEALACGTPVVSPDVGGVREVLRPEANGLLVEPPDAASYAALLGRLRDSLDLRKRLRAGAAEDAPSLRFERSLDELERLLKTAVATRPRVVLFGRARIAPTMRSTFIEKLRVFDEVLDTIVVGTGGGRASRVGNTRVVPVPASTIRPLGMPAFYAVGSALAVGIASTRRASAIVCQSPFEASACLLARQLVPSNFRPLIVVEAHGDWTASSRLYGTPVRRLMAPLADRVADLALRRADRVRVVGTALERAVRAAGYQGEVDRFPTFSDFNAFLREPPAPLPARPRALFVGGLVKPKGVDLLLHAWATVSRALPDARLELIGDGPLRDELASQSEQLGLSRFVTFVGALPPDRLPSEIDRCSCLVLPSRSEGSPRVIMEALARGRPVIGTAVGGIPEMIVDGETGVLIRPEDVQALEAAMLDLLNDGERLRRAGSAGRRWVELRNPISEYEAGVARLAEWLAGGPLGHR
jgi:glycosyltransferase involved in cell wall biosynthesis